MKATLRFVVLGLLALGLGLLGCNKGGGSASNELDVVSFQGGYGLDFFEKCAKEYEASHPGVKIKVSGNPRVWEQLRPRFVAGNPPDLSWPGWGMDYWALVYDGQLVDLNEALDGPAYDGTGKWRDTFALGMLEPGQHEGHQYMMPYHYNINGWWFDPKVFAKHGWKPPKTWEELLALCPKIKAAGIAPITFQGQYPYYMLAGFFFPWTIANGGVGAFDAMQSLEPGAWNSPAAVRAAEMIVELRDKGHFQKGAIGMSHTESQTEFLNGHAAMIPCGTWLHSEMRDSMPPEADMEFMLPPVPANAKDPTAIAVGIEPWIVPAKGKNPKLAIDFYKYMTSLPEAKEFVVQKGTLMAIKGSDEVDLPKYLLKPAELVRNSQAVWSSQYGLWYKEFSKETENAMAALLNGEASAKEFCDRCEKAATKARNDPNVKKHKVQR